MIRAVNGADVVRAVNGTVNGAAEGAKLEQGQQHLQERFDGKVMEGPWQVGGRLMEGERYLQEHFGGEAREPACRSARVEEEHGVDGGAVASVEAHVLGRRPERREQRNLVRVRVKGEGEGEG